jgi:hypothetical protein
MIAGRDLSPEERTTGIATQSRNAPAIADDPAACRQFHRDFATPPGAFAKSLRISYKPRGAVE